jgi:hypothetical protein
LQVGTATGLHASTLMAWLPSKIFFKPAPPMRRYDDQVTAVLLGVLDDPFRRIFVRPHAQLRTRRQVCPMVGGAFLTW